MNTAETIHIVLFELGITKADHSKRSDFFSGVPLLNGNRSYVLLFDSVPSGSPVGPPKIHASLGHHFLASPSSMTNVMTQKYVDGIPLAWQVKIWKRDDIALPSATMSNWVIQARPG